MTRRLLKQAGFSLVEMAMVVSVLGVLVGGALTMTTSKMESKALDNTDQKLDYLQTAIKKYYDKNGYLPCPASPTAAESSTSFGVATDCSSSVTAPSDTWEASSSGDKIRGGVVPTRTLGIPDTYMYDQWDNRIGYVVIKALATTSTAYTAYTTALTTGVIQITDTAGNQIPDANVKNIVTYALISYGKDKKGAFGRKVQSGNTPVAACGTTAKDSENCDNNDAIIIDAEVKDSVTTANFYYDKVRWATRTYATTTAASPSAPSPSTPPPACTGAPALIQKTAPLYTVGATTVTRSFATTPTAGNTIIVVATNFRMAASGAAPTVTAANITDNQGGTYTYASGNQGVIGTANVGVHILYRSNITAPSGTYTVTYTQGTAEDISLQVYEVSNLLSTSPIDTAGTAGSVMADVQYLTLTGTALSQAQNFIIAGYSADGAGFTLTTPSSGWVVGGSTNWMGSLYSITTASTAQTVRADVGGLGATDDITGVMVTFKGCDSSTPSSSVVTNSMAAGGMTTCAIKNADNTLWCWGYDAYGQIGDGTFSGPRFRPYATSGGKTWKKITLGGNSDANVCALASDNTAWCWGFNQYGAVGNGTTSTRNVPTAVSGGGTWADIAGGAYTSCGIKSDGTAWCWGHGTEGSLGNGGSAHSSVPVAVSGGYTWKKIYTGENGNAACAIKSDDTLWCWGYNDASGGHTTYGALGVGSTGNKLVPTQVGTSTWSSASTNGYTNGCGIKLSDSTLWCWGARYLNWNGNGAMNTTELSPVQIGTSTWLKVSVGYNHSCGIKSDNTLWCWGDARADSSTTNFSYYGNGSATQINALVQVIAGSYTQFTDVGAAYTHACAIEKTTGTMFCWGDNWYGQLGSGTNNTTLPGSSVPCAIESTATWGSAAPATTTTLSGCSTSTVVPMKSIYAGGATACGVTSTGQGYCWGYNGDGELGISGDTANKLVPTAVTGGAIWSGIDQGDTLTCGIKKADQSAWCWGAGALGDGAGWQAGTSVAKKVAGSATWAKVATGTETGCGIKTDKTLWCWGTNYGGLLGNGATSGYQASPAQVTGGGTWIDVTIGTCGIKTDKKLYCWGNVNGSSTPVLYDSGSWEKVSGGIWDANWHVCGIKTGGAAYCFGDGYLGTLGDGNAAAHTATTPVAVIGGNTFTELAMTQNVSCGLLSSGAVKCWGYGQFGQLGNGVIGGQATPTLVSGGDVFTTIDGGWRNICGIRTDKTVKCWGASGDGTTGLGAIGDGGTANRTTPTAVSGGYLFGP